MTVIQVTSEVNKLHSILLFVDWYISLISVSTTKNILCSLTFQSDHRKWTSLQAVDKALNFVKKYQTWCCPEQKKFPCSYLVTIKKLHLHMQKQKIIHVRSKTYNLEVHFCLAIKENLTSNKKKATKKATRLCLLQLQPRFTFWISTLLNIWALIADITFSHIAFILTTKRTVKTGSNKYRRPILLSSLHSGSGLAPTSTSKNCPESTNDINYGPN